MKHLVRPALFAGAIAFVCSPALAKPIAPAPPLSKDGKQYYAYTHKTPQPCPEAAAVGVPAYPGSVCLGEMRDTTKGEPAAHRMYPRVVLVTAAPLATVAAWYKAHLPRSWAYHPQMKNFAPPGWSIAKAMRSASIVLRPIDKMHPVFGAAFFKTGPVKTAITIMFKPQG